MFRDDDLDDDDDLGLELDPFLVLESIEIKSCVGVDVCVFLRVVTRWEPIYPGLGLKRECLKYRGIFLRCSRGFVFESLHFQKLCFSKRVWYGSWISMS